MTADDLITSCRIAARPENNAKGYVSSGASWFCTGPDLTLYNHAQAPNGKVPDGLLMALPPFGMATARSRHLGGVNVLMGDGSTRFVGETINQDVWRGLGTRNGQELVD
jgi:prepilin-type processing-associated H-X9-DG protein